MTFLLFATWGLAVILMIGLVFLNISWLGILFGAVWFISGYQKLKNDREGLGVFMLFVLLPSGMLFLSSLLFYLLQVFS